MSHSFSFEIINMGKVKRPQSVMLRITHAIILLSLLLLLWYSISEYRESSENILHDKEIINVELSDDNDDDNIQISFNLKHIYNELPSVGSLALDIVDDDTHNINTLKLSTLKTADIDISCSIKAKKSKIKRLKNRSPSMVESYIYHSLENPHINTEDSIEWSIDNVLVPDIKDPETILQLAKLASNAYSKLPEDPSWRNVSDPGSNFGVGFNISDSFGWLENGLRGHVFIEQLDSKTAKKRAPLIIIAIKGTTAAGITSIGGDKDTDDATGDDGKTIELDKINDNLLFSCCCARVSSLWTTVCDCYEKTYTCNQNCLERSLRKPDRYYEAVLNIYRKVLNLYPDSEVWVTGHSLGGAMSSLLGRTYGLPVVTFETPGEMLATKRLHLPMPPGLPVEMEHIWHFGNNADPIFMGVCNGASSSCSIAGYAMESFCHSGMKCTYDTINELGWHVNILNHRLKNVIDNLLMLSNETAVCEKPPPCVDCYDWTFVDHNENKRRTPKHPSSSTTPLPTSTHEPKPRKCLKRTWYGSCYKWSDDDDDDDSKSLSYSYNI